MQSEFPSLADVIPTPKTVKELEENYLSISLAYQNYNGAKSTKITLEMVGKDQNAYLKKLKVG